MKTPRLALFAFLALALAPLANAALPTWTVVEEGPRSWARVFFTVGKENKTLRCRYNECKPERKTVSDLYVIAPVGKATPTKVTIYKMVPRSKWNPKYYTDGPYDKVPEVINANAQPYSSELSNFKLDNTGAKLMVVQGDKKFPASTDINEAQFNSYDQMKVSPPAKMADDVLKPDAPAAGPENGGRRGRGGNGGSGDAAKKWWCDPKTGDKYSAVHGRKGSTLLASKDAVCKKTGSGAAPVVTQPPVAGALLLSARERIWLDRRQAHDYEAEKTAAEAKPAAEKAAAIKAVAEKYRKLVVENLAPNTTASTAYAAAAADPKAAAETIDKTLPAEVWGGKNDAIVENFGPRAEIQLSREDWEVLNSTDAAGKQKYADALAAYTRDRTPANGKVGQAPEYRKDFYDPIVLHRTAEAARKVLGAGPATGPGTGPALDTVNLTEEQKKLLSPDELNKYEKQVENAAKADASKETKEALYKMNAEYKGMIKGRKPYVQPKNAAAFEKMEDWQKKRFCAGLPAPSAVIAIDQSTELKGTGRGANADLAANDPGKQSPNGAQASGGDAGKDWSKDDQDAACKKFKEQLALTPTQPANSGRGSLGTTVPIPKPNGPEAENKEKEKSKWLTQDLLTSAAKGAMVGLLVGSLFGPAGLILGPLIGGALFYGLTKITS